MYKNAPMKLDPSMSLVPTSLDGIFAKVRSPENVAEPLSIAPLIHSSVLARLQETDTPAARIFRDKVLYRHWRPEDQIVPSFGPQSGATHQLTPRNRATNTAFTSGNWAGGTIQGVWTAAFGIWRVPTVTRPTIQPGTSGGWASSSWVGIDGASPDASTDVLQAGVRQQVSAGGGASYFAWFEWFIPKELRTPDSPRYVLETPIDNMQIEPGDEVFSAIYYVGRQGEIMFGNIDRGHYFSMVLEPPKGASFNGTSAEWIMEAPDTGEPGTSLPSFTPVVFSTAFSNGPGSTTGDPAKGDTTNILRLGSTLTSVSLRPEALEIDYIGTDWQHNVPGAASSVSVLPGTSPTSWYTTPENVQHIAYIGATDNRIHELFFRIGTNQGWLQNLPSGAPGSVPAANFTSPTSWYTTPENIQHIAYVGTDKLIHELFFRLGTNQGWLHNLPSGAPGSVPVAEGTSPTSWYTTPENVQHVAYVGATDNRIHELFFRIGANQGWLHNFPGGASSVSVLPGTSPTSWYTTPENVQHIAYVGTDKLIHELFFRLGTNQGWLHNLPSAAQGAVAVATGTSPTSWYTKPENVQHIAYVGNDGLIHELFFQIGGDGAWRHNLPSAAQGAVPVAPGTSPTSWYTTPENIQHIAYAGTDGLIHELFFKIGGDGAWRHNLPSAAPGAVPVRPFTSPTSWYTTPENVQHIGYVGNDGLVHELFYRIG